MLRPCFLLLAAGLTALAGCGQSGPLYLPHDPAAAQRATLPETLNPARPDTPSPSAATPP